MNEPEKIREALASAETIAVVGCSPNPARASHAIARYLLGQGYRVVPVNPGHREILGQPCYRSLLDVPREVRIDVVDVFRRSDAVSAIAAQAIERADARFFFMQLGVLDADSARRLEAAGIGVAMDRCILVEHQRFRISPRVRNAAAGTRVALMSENGGNS